MPAFIFAALAALLAGFANGLQNPTTSLIGQRVGPLGAAFAVHLGGAIVGGILLLVTPAATTPAWRTVPWPMLLAGALGVVILASISYTIPRIGLVATVGLFLTAQLSVSTWLDHHGMMGVAPRPLDLTRILGIGLLMLGAWLVLRR